MMRAKVTLKSEVTPGTRVETIESDEVMVDMGGRPDNYYWEVDAVRDGMSWSTTYYPVSRVLKVQVETINQEDDE